MGTDVAEMRALQQSYAELRDSLARWASPERPWDLWDFVGLTRDDCSTIRRWLARLQDAFLSERARYTRVVCAMVATVCADERFRAVFLPQVRANLECCTDRATMAFNELYVLWKTSTCTELDQAARLEVCCAAAKTNTLRTLMTHHAGDRESVEFYLWAERSLADQLGLLTLVRIQCHTFDRFKLINLDSLAARVRMLWRTSLFDMLEGWPADAWEPAFPMALSTPVEARLHAQLDAALDRKGLPDSEYLRAIRVVQARRTNALFHARVAWLEGVCRNKIG